MVESVQLSREETSDADSCSHHHHALETSTERVVHTQKTVSCTVSGPDTTLGNVTLTKPAQHPVCEALLVWTVMVFNREEGNLAPPRIFLEISLWVRNLNYGIMTWCVWSLLQASLCTVVFRVPYTV